MQELIEELIRGLGYVLLRILTFGRYRTSPDNRLLEGVVGFVLVIAVTCAIYAFGAATP